MTHEHQPANSSPEAIELESAASGPNVSTHSRPKPAENQSTFLAGRALTFSFDASQYTEFVAEADGPINWARFHDNLGRTVCDLDLIAPGNVALRSPCSRCGVAKVPSDDGPSVRRVCGDCGENQFHTTKDGTEGPIVKKGESVLFPLSLITSKMRYAGGASFTRTGIDWLARELFGLSVPRDIDNMLGFLGQWKVLADNLLREDPFGSLFESSSPADVERVCDFVRKNPESNTLVATLVSTKVDVLRESLSNATEEARTLALDVFQASSAQAVMAFRFAAEDACFRANALERLKWLIVHCRKNLENADEGFWQKTILDNPFAITHLFASPVVIHGERFYVGGIRAGGKHGKIADFVLRNKLTTSAIILEIKTPASHLLRDSEYRQDVYLPSTELTGAVQQVLEQRAQFTKHIDSLQSDLEPDVPRVESGVPECVVLLGHAARDLKTRAKRRCFEAYRNELRTVRIIAFDELLARLEGLLELMGIGDSAEAPPNSALHQTVADAPAGER